MNLEINFDLGRDFDNVARRNDYSQKLNELCNKIRVEENNDLFDAQSAKVNSDWSELSHQVIGFENF